MQPTERFDSLDAYFDYAAIYWSGISHTGLRSITPGDQWAIAYHDAKLLIGDLDPLWRSQSTVLEFGSGEGRLAVPLSNHFKRYIGVDISPACIARSKELKLSNASFELIESVSQIPVGVQCIVSWTVFMHMPEASWRQIMKALSDCLEPGGYFCFQLNDQDTSESHRYDAVPDSNLWEGRWYPDDYVHELLKSLNLTPAFRQGQIWTAHKPSL